MNFTIIIYLIGFVGVFIGICAISYTLITSYKKDKKIDEKVIVDFLPEVRDYFEKWLKIEVYEHHDQMVYVQSHLKGKHKEHCLCYQQCKRFKPGEIDNCFLAQEIFELCKKANVVLPVWECPLFSVEEKEEDNA